MERISIREIDEFLRFLENLSKKTSDKKRSDYDVDRYEELPPRLEIKKEDLKETNKEEYHDCTVITRVFETGNTTLTVSTRIPKVKKPTEKEMWEESIDSIVEDLDQEIAWAEENNKPELLKLLNRKRDFILSKR